jgi:Leucine-rich repeat (LRR) protein
MAEWRKKLTRKGTLPMNIQSAIRSLICIEQGKQALDSTLQPIFAYFDSLLQDPKNTHLIKIEELSSEERGALERLYAKMERASVDNNAEWGKAFLIFQKALGKPVNSKAPHKQSSNFGLNKNLIRSLVKEWLSVHHLKKLSTTNKFFQEIVDTRKLELLNKGSTHARAGIGDVFALAARKGPFFKKLDLSSYDLANLDLPESENQKKLASCLKNCSNITTLVLHNCGLAQKDFEPLMELLKTTKITHLILSQNELKEISDSIAHLRDLQFLDLSNNFLEKLSSNICLLTDLQHLILSHNSLLTTLPEELKECKKLHTLSLVCTKFMGSLPPVISKLSSLKSLYLGWPQCAQPLYDLSELQSLEDLGLQGRALTQIPEWVYSLKNLKELDLQDNQLESFPLVLCNLTSLKVLNIGNNLITYIPKEISQLIHLKKLYINKLDISNRDQLKELLPKDCEIFCKGNI